MATKKVPIHAVILAAGQGKRINAKDIPKVLYPVCGKPMLHYVYNAIKPVADDVTFIIGFQGNKVKAAMKDKPVKFAFQAERLGTAHAVMQAERLLKDKDGYVLITNGDQPLYTSKSFEHLITKAIDGDYTLCIKSAIEDNYPSYGRVLRDKDNKVIGVIETKDATPEQNKIREKNIGTYIAKSSWLWPALKRIKKSKVTGEYYITDLVEIAISDGESVEAVPAETTDEIMGVNTMEELEKVEEILGCR